MRRLFECADRYLKTCTWRDIALLKLCLCSMGVVLGLLAPRQQRRPLLWTAGVLFFATYIPLMVRFLRTVAGCSPQPESSDE